MVIRLPELEDGKRFLVSAVYWKRLSEPRRAGLLAHELIYEHLAKLGATDSRASRKFVALLFSPKFKDMSSGDFWLFMKELKVPVYP